MRIKGEDGVERCSSCGKEWIEAEGRPRYCNNCLCPDTYLEAIDDIAVYQSGVMKEVIGGPLKPQSLHDLKGLLKETIAKAVPPMSWEELCERQPRAKMLD